MSYCISTNEETFSEECESRDAALHAAIFGQGMRVGDVFWIGQAAPRKASSYFDVDRILEQIAEGAYEDVGEAAEGWPDMSEEETAQLAKLIGDFLDEHAAPSFFGVEQLEKITVTPELFAKYGGEDLPEAEVQPAAEIRRCRVCGCTDTDCRQCIAKTGEPCHWVEPDLCSACVVDVVLANGKAK